jgi:hypothetical protein
MAERFRGFLPVVIDVETAGFNPRTDALLEIAAVTLTMDENGYLMIDQSYDANVIPFPGALGPVRYRKNRRTVLRHRQQLEGHGRLGHGTGHPQLISRARSPDNKKPAFPYMKRGLFGSA